MSVFSHNEFDNHEQIQFCHDEATGLKAIIAIHNTNRGPALEWVAVCGITPAMKRH